MADRDPVRHRLFRPLWRSAEVGARRREGKGAVERSNGRKKVCGGVRYGVLATSGSYWFVRLCRVLNRYEVNLSITVKATMEC